MGNRRLVLLNDMALQMKPDAVAPGEAARIYVAGSNLVRMTLAELALPGAEMIWTDFRHSASLCGLHQAMQAAGGVDRMVIAADGAHREAALSTMGAVLTLLPSLRSGSGAEVELISSPGKAARSLAEFVDRMRPQLDRKGVHMSLEILTHHPDRTPA